MVDIGLHFGEQLLTIRSMIRMVCIPSFQETAKKYFTKNINHILQKKPIKRSIYPSFLQAVGIHTFSPMAKKV